MERQIKPAKEDQAPNISDITVEQLGEAFHRELFSVPESARIQHVTSAMVDALIDCGVAVEFNPADAAHSALWDAAIQYERQRYGA